MPRKNKNLIDIVTPGSSEITSRKKSNKKRSSRKQKSQQLKEKIREDFRKNNVGVDSGYTNADIEAITEMRTLSEQKNGKETYLNQFLVFLTHFHRQYYQVLNCNHHFLLIF